MTWWEVTLLGLLAGVIGTGAGGLCAIFLNRPNPRFLGAILAFAAGVMLSIVFLELMIESMASSGYPAALAGLALGMGAFYLLDHYLPHHHPVSTEDHGQGAFLKKGVLLALGIGLHNLPEGLAIGAGFSGSTGLGLTLTILIGLHDIPEGMAVAAPLKFGGYSYPKVLLVTALSGAPMGLGALAGTLIGGISPTILSLSLAFAAGAMLYIVCDELIPDAYETAGSHLSIAGIFVGVTLGIVFTEIFN